MVRGYMDRERLVYECGCFPSSSHFAALITAWLSLLGVGRNTLLNQGFSLVIPAASL